MIIMFDVLFTPAVFPGNESKTDIITESRLVNSDNAFTTTENISRTRRIKRRGNRQVILPPYGYSEVWQG